MNKRHDGTLICDGIIKAWNDTMTKIAERDEQHDHEKAILEDLLRECEPYAVGEYTGCYMCRSWELGPLEPSHKPDCPWAVAVGWKK